MLYDSLDALFDGYHGDYLQTELDTGEDAGQEVIE